MLLNIFPFIFFISYQLNATKQLTDPFNVRRHSAASFASEKVTNPNPLDLGCAPDLSITMNAKI